MTLYWILEYLKVLGGYVFLMFVWPSVVFGGHLRRKARGYRFGFCVTVQIVIVNTAVLMPGIFHFLNQRVIFCVFYGVFLVGLARDILAGHILSDYILRLQNLAEYLLGKEFTRTDAADRAKGYLSRLRGKRRPRFAEYAMFTLLLLLAMVYFSHSAFQNYVYGFGDLYTHHAWIYGLVEGKIFYDGIYPEAMHCFVYSLHTLTGVRIYSILLFLQPIHVIVFLTAAYFLMREVFHWRCVPLFVLGAFLLLDIKNTEALAGISRLQWTLPMEFGLHTEFLCALYMVRFLRAGRSGEGRKSGIYLDENLFLFMMSVAASVATHFYTTIMAVFMCICFALFQIRRIFSREHFPALIVAALAGLAVAVVPMGAAFASGIPFQDSMEWAVKVIQGKDDPGRPTASASWNQDGMEVYQEQRRMDIAYARHTGELNRKPAGREWAGNSAAFAKAAQSAGEISGYVRQKAGALYREGYVTLYGEKRGFRFVGLTLVSLLLWFLLRLAFHGRFREAVGGYPPVILASVLFVTAFAASKLGLPQLVDAPRLCSTGHMLLLAVAAMPLDVLFLALAVIFRDSVLQGLSVWTVAGICGATVATGNYHGYLYDEVSRYEAAVMVTDSIIRTLPAHTYTVVSPTDDRSQVLGYGYHEELQDFVRGMEDENYRIPTEYVYIYVEKKPIQYGQFCFYDGPAWLAEDKYPELFDDPAVPQGSAAWEERYPGVPGVSRCSGITVSEVSEQAAGGEVNYAYINPWSAYKNFDNRTILESRAYYWCQDYMQSHPWEMQVYYEDENFVCYCLKQDISVF